MSTIFRLFISLESGLLLMLVNDIPLKVRMRMEFGEIITNKRNQLGLSTTKLAKMAGIAQSTLREIQLGNTSPTWDTIVKICGALGVPPNQIADFLKTDQPDFNESLLKSIEKFDARQKKYLLDFLQSL